jgi:NitT/TauT family transport system permease protein
MDRNPAPKVNPARGRVWLQLASLGAGLLCWQLTSQIGGIATFILPPPIRVWDRFIAALTAGTLLIDAEVTLAEVILGLIVGVALATLLGYAIAKSRSLDRVLSPYLVASQAIPIVAIAPLIVLWFGYGMLSKVLICALIVFFPVLINIIVGLRGVPSAFYDLMNSLHASKSQILTKVEIPAALPVFLAGLRIGATLSVIGAVVGELVGSNNGLGSMITRGRVSYDMPLVYVGVITLIAMAVTLYGLVTLLERKFLRWQERFEQ